MADLLTQQGYFSVLRWRRDATRDEARNVAVILVEAKGKFGGVRPAPLSLVSARLHDQGILDAMILGLQKQFTGEVKPDLDTLNSMFNSMQHSVYLTPPKPVAVTDVDTVLTALYKAYVAPRVGGSRGLTKGRLLDRVVDRLRLRGFEVKRGETIGDFTFDAMLVRPNHLSVVEVLSFATTALDWRPVEHDAGHFLFALERVSTPGLAVIQPPTENSRPTAGAAHERVLHWFDAAGVSVVGPEQLAEVQLV